MPKCAHRGSRKAAGKKESKNCRNPNYGVATEVPQDQFIINLAVTEKVLSFLDFPHQKICRLVCHSWNKEICRAFKKHKVITYVRGKDHLEGLKKTCEANKRLTNLPFPFRSIAMTIEKENLGAFIEFSKDYAELIVVAKFVIKYNADDDEEPMPSKYFELLRSTIAPNVVHLETKFWTLNASSELSFPKLERLLLSQCRLPSEEDSKLIDKRDFRKKEEDFFKQVIHASPNLVRLEFKGDEILVKSILDHPLKRVQSVKISSISKGLQTTALLALKSSQFDCLRSLILDLEDKSSFFSLSDGEHPNERLVKEVILRFSSTLQYLKLQVSSISWDEFPPCPSLTHLDLSYLHLGHFNWGSLSQLKSVNLGGIGFGTHEEDAQRSSKKEDVLCRSAKAVRFFTARPYEEDRVPTIVKLFHFFPNASHWKLDNCLFVPEFCQVAGAGKVKVHRLGIRSSSAQWEKLGADCDLTSCLKKLKDLKELDLYTYGQHYSVKPTSFDFGELPNIQIFRLHLSSQRLNVKLLKEKLKPLRRVELLFPSAYKWDDKLEEFLSQMPNVTCRYFLRDIGSSPSI